MPTLSPRQFQTLRKRMGNHAPPPLQPRVQVTQPVLPATQPRRLSLGTIVIPGEPKGKQRARVFWDKAVQRMVAKTPDETHEAEQRMAKVVCTRLNRFQPDARSRFRVEARFYMGDRRRRDVDNLGKLVLDALNTRVWADDTQVFEVCFTKDITDLEHPRTELTIYRLE